MRNPSTPPGRLWAARIALLLACLGSIATSPSPPGPAAWSQEQDISWTLSRQSPTAVRHFRLEVSEDQPTTRRLELNVSVALMTRWTPDSPNRAANPAIRARLLAPSELMSDPAWSPSSALQENAEGTVMASQVEVTASALTLSCDTQSACAWSFTLEAELQANDPGTVEVEGTTSINVAPLGVKQLPPGFRLRILEE